ncbi:hypothetical protein E7T06_18465 [Deinococcus sp. Arct2-2]|uniref:hypothetical protein n=1 Tax=Deinococcus sp. Arct2-2 TaxID=2568653 RepID=UPI0010A3D0C4|nr:hypothetical protein [Deinococcus sp. Arct2-2]THF68023.1 hypothetical protein E7T06_18465 [Deinococcus sp. Arct2-2]
MTPKLRIIQTNSEQLVVKAPTEEFIAEAQKALSAQKGVLIFEKNGWMYHLSASHIIRLELSQDHDDQEDETES